MASGVFCSGCISIFNALYTGSGPFTAKTYKKMRPAAQISVSPSDMKPHIKPLPVKSYYPGRRFGQSEIEDITALCLQFYLYKSIAHGEDHIISSIRYAAALARSECPQQFNDVIVGAALHDVGRTDDSGGNAHAFASSKLARTIINHYWPMLNTDKIADAIYHHADGRISSDKLVGSINPSFLPAKKLLLVPKPPTGYWFDRFEIKFSLS